MCNVKKAEQCYVEYKLNGWLDLRKEYMANVDQNIENKTIEQAFIEKFNILVTDLEKIKEKHADIQELRNKFNSKKNSVSDCEFEFKDFKEFYKWYKRETKRGEICCYCGVKQKDIQKSNINLRSKRGEKRGNSIEIERIDTRIGKNIYSPRNCRLACYVCNNAKSDLLTVKEFKPIAEGINKMWSKLFKKEISMPKEVYRTF